MSPTPSVVYRVELERGGARIVRALVASSLEEAARRAHALAAAPGDRVRSLHLVGPLL